MLSISNGFTKSLEKAEKESLSEYPIFISETSTDALEELDEIFENKSMSEEYIYSKNTYSENIIDDRLINLIDSLDSKYKVYNYITKDNKIITNVSNNYLDNLLLSHHIKNGYHQEFLHSHQLGKPYHLYQYYQIGYDKFLQPVFQYH